MPENSELMMPENKQPMTPQPAPNRWLRSIFLGGVIGVDVMWVGLALSSASSALMGAFVILGAAGFVAMIAGLVANERASEMEPHSRLERTLSDLKKMHKQGLLDDEEFSRMKARLIEDYDPQARAPHRPWMVVLWAALIVSALVSLVYMGGISGLLVGTGVGAAVGGALGVSAEAALGTGQTRPPAFPGRPRHRALPEGGDESAALSDREWEALGTGLKRDE